MDFKKLVNKAKKTIDDRGGVESLKADAKELKDVATGKGTLKDKAKNAAEAIKKPGGPGKEVQADMPDRTANEPGAAAAPDQPDVAEKPVVPNDPPGDDKPAGPGGV